MVQCGCSFGSNSVIAISPQLNTSKSPLIIKSKLTNNESKATQPLQETTPFTLPIQKVCRYCHRPITLSNACRPEFKDIIRESIDLGNDINGVFKELCHYYLTHFNSWKTKYIDNMFSDLYEVVGKNYSSLLNEDKKDLNF